MTQSPLRLERKYVLNPQASLEWEARLRVHPAGFQRQFPDRWVHNVYFDSNNMDFFQAHQQGIAQRKKVRLRWYGATSPAAEQVVHLEEKIRCGQEGYKRSHPMNWRTASSQEPAGLQAVLRNAYRRSYFQTSSQIRLTVDQQLWVARPTDWQTDQWSFETALNPTIIELKYAAEQETEVSQWCQHFPWRLSRSSKYVMGCQCIYGN